MEQKTISFWDPNLFIRQLIWLWIKHSASDIHITPSKKVAYIRFRIGWELNSFYNIDFESYERLLNSIKIWSGMDATIHENIQDWKLFYNLEINSKPTPVNARVSCLPTVHWENVVLRILLSESEYLDLDKLGFSPKNTEILKKIPKIKDWLVLCCWWTGSWKTTTLYSLLNSYDPKKTWVFTLEDPVEYQIEWYIQSEIRNDITDKNTNSSYTFQEWFTWILRQDPDVLLIWEIRRPDEAKICLEAANTGHIVYWSIHSNNAISVVTRLKQLWMEPFLLATWLKYIISQKLLRKLCPVCRVKQKVAKESCPEAFHHIVWEEGLDVFSANKSWCDKCINWFKWSSLVSEIVVNNEDFYKLIIWSNSDVEIKRELMKNWYEPFYIHWLEKAKAGEFDIKDVFSIVY